VEGWVNRVWHRKWSQHVLFALVMDVAPIVFADAELLSGADAFVLNRSLYISDLYIHERWL
jgi:hypothetical protein